MPDVLNRSEKESRVANALQTLREDQRARLIRYLGDPPDIRRVPDSFWVNVQQEEEQAMLLLLLLIAEDAAEGLLSGANASNDQRLAIATGIRGSIAPRARGFGANSAANTRSLVADEIARVRTGEVERIDWDRVFSPSRADNAGITETTGASSVGEMQVVEVAKRAKQQQDRMEPREQGTGDGEGTGDKIVVPEVIWHTEDDASVCPICRPLHLKGESVWGGRFPNGPPAHPRCRCWLKIGTLNFGRSGLGGTP